MCKSSEYNKHFRLGIIFATVIISIFISYQLKYLSVNSDSILYLKPDNLAVDLFKHVEEKYIGTELVMVGIETVNGFNNKALSKINLLTEKFNQIEDVVYIMSLKEILDIKRADGDIEIGYLINKNTIPSEPDGLELTRDYAMFKDIHNWRIVSPEGKTAKELLKINC